MFLNVFARLKVGKIELPEGPFQKVSNLRFCLRLVFQPQ